MFACGRDANLPICCTLDAAQAFHLCKLVNVQRIKDRWSNGFKPFVVYTSDGRKFDVPHPEFIAVGQGVVVIINKRDRVHTIDALHITAVEEQTAKK